MVFRYRITTGRESRTGPIQAASLDEAKKKCARMNIKYEAIWEDGAPEPAAAEAEEEAPPPLKRREDFQPPPPPAGAIQGSLDAKPPQPNPIPQMGMGNHMANLRDSVAIAKKLMDKETAPERRESLFYGPYEEIRGFVDDALGQNGVVRHLTVSPDTRGKLQMAIVIEHDKGSMK